MQRVIVDGARAQAMVNDHLEIDESGAVTPSKPLKGGEKAAQLFLNENDELWVELRHEHIAKVIHTLGERVKELSKNAGAKLAKVHSAS